MNSKRLKFVLLGVGIAASMSFLVMVGVSGPDGFVYYLSVTEFVEQGAESGDFRVNGKVDAGSIERLPTGEDVRFVMTDGTTTLPVSYHGIIPDTVVDDADVVVEGRLQDDGTFLAHELLAKCPSKYESADGAGEATAYGAGGAAPHAAATATRDASPTLTP